ncbi:MULTISPECIES: gluconokinase [Halomonadaceae]|uniref:gluconokinase n=1 Tax=Halomonadaceae TaxID=28256 RepID=UPI0015981DB2|nr:MULTISPECIES: gluconokinase [Halomonas]QJQ95021.1 gluconokinase [Halomonas sp. PA5]
MTVIRPAEPLCLVVMGVSGVGKTTTAEGLATRLGWTLAEADQFHPQANIDKMSAGTPLNDEDRGPWLATLRDWVSAQADAGECTVVTCSALKRRYRDLLRGARCQLRFVHLMADAENIAERLEQRRGHFMPGSLLGSQFADLEPLADDESGVSVCVDLPPDALVERALQTLGLATR